MYIIISCWSNSSASSASHGCKSASVSSPSWASPSPCPPSGGQSGFASLAQAAVLHLRTVVEEASASTKIKAAAYASGAGGSERRGQAEGRSSMGGGVGCPWLVSVVSLRFLEDGGSRQRALLQTPEAACGRSLVVCALDWAADSNHYAASEISV